MTGIDQFIRVVCVVTLALLGLGAALAVLGFGFTVRPPRYVSHRTPADLGWAYEQVALHTRDGLTLSGWFVPRAAGGDGKRAIIVLHGYPFDKGNILSVTPFLHDEYDLLLFDFRYFGSSEGAVSTVGAREWQDVVAAVEYLQERGAASIGAWGFSLGASAALLALPHTDHIRAVVADSSYSDLGAMALDYYSFIPPASRALAFGTDLLSRLTFGIHLADVSPLRAAESTRLPLLFIHGSGDGTIRVHHFEALQRALADRPAVEFWLVDRAGHGLTYAAERDAYQSRVLEFFARNLPRQTDSNAQGKGRITHQSVTRDATSAGRVG